MSHQREPVKVQAIDEGANITLHLLEGVALASNALTVAPEIESDAAPASREGPHRWCPILGAAAESMQEHDRWTHSLFEI